MMLLAMRSRIWEISSSSLSNCDSTRMRPAVGRTEFVYSHCFLARKRLAFRSEESVYAVVGGRRSRRRTLRPGDRADPGLASVRGRNWFGSSRYGGFEDVIET